MTEFILYSTYVYKIMLVKALLLYPTPALLASESYVMINDDSAKCRSGKRLLYLHLIFAVLFLLVELEVIRSTSIKLSQCKQQS